MQKQPGAKLTSLAARSQSLRHGGYSAAVALWLPRLQPWKLQVPSVPLHCSNAVLACREDQGGDFGLLRGCRYGTSYGNGIMGVG